MNVWQSRQRRRQGLLMSYQQLQILQYMREACDTGFPFVALDGVHGRTINSLIRHDWIVESPGLDGTRYKITGRGLKALAIFEEPVQTPHPLCSRCQQRPRRTRQDGSTGCYCVDCYRRIHREHYAEYGNQLRPDGLCAACKKRKRHVYASGFVIAYCQQCRNARRTAERKRKRARLLRRVQAGEVIPCTRRGCSEPRYVSGKTVQEFCYAHYREYQNERRIARQRERFQQIMQGVS